MDQKYQRQLKDSIKSEAKILFQEYMKHAVWYHLKTQSHEFEESEAKKK